MDDKSILVSVICTAYNHEKYIKDTLDGFAQQKTDFAFEVLIHDDASRDNTAEIILEYAKKYPNIIKPIIQTENQFSKGVLILNEILYPMARGKYIAFCEGDDFWTNPNKLQMQIDFLEKNVDYSACVHNSTFRFAKQNKKDELMVANSTEHDVEFRDVIMGMRHAYQSSSLVVRKEFLLEVPDFCYVAYKAGFGDLPNSMWFTICGKVKFLPQNMSTYRFMSSPDSWSVRSANNEKMAKHTVALIEMYESARTIVPEVCKKYIDKAIRQEEFNLLQFTGKYAKMKKPPFTQIYKKQPLGFKIKNNIKLYFPWVYKAFLRVKK